MSIAKDEGSMKLYRIWQTVNNYYDTFDSAVVAARDEEDARSIHPLWHGLPDSYTPTVTPTAREAEEEEEENGPSEDDTWTTRENVEVKFLGICSPDVKRGVICASYNAG